MTPLEQVAQKLANGEISDAEALAALKQSTTAIEPPATTSAATASRKPRSSYQDGSIRLRKGAKSAVWHLYFRSGGKMTSARIVEKDDKHFSERAVRRECADKIAELLNTSPAAVAAVGTLKIADYWHSFWTYCTSKFRGGEGMKHSTRQGYLQLWGADCKCAERKRTCHHLAAHFGTKTLAEYTTLEGNDFLRERAEAGLSKNTVAHIKNLATAIFARAVVEYKVTGLTVNPWATTEMPDKNCFAKIKETPHYTLRETETIIGALVDHSDLQFVLALSCYLGLRPNETAALRWEDFADGNVEIRRGFVRGVLNDDPKTFASIRTLPVIKQVSIHADRWHQQCGRPTSGFVFKMSNGEPINVRQACARVIVPHVNGGTCHECKTKQLPSGVEWKGLYAGRRGTATTLTELGIAPAVVQGLLGHAKLSTTFAHYTKPAQQKVLVAGMKDAEQKLELDAQQANA